MLQLKIFEDCFSLKSAFTISRGSKTQAQVIRVELDDATVQGHGECVPYARYGETVQSVIGQIQNLPGNVTRNNLQTLLPAGAARNAVDCALWDMEAKRQGIPVWQLAGQPEPLPLTTAFTLSLDTPQAMQSQASANAFRPLLKLKLGSADDLARLKAVRQGAPDSEIIVDANEAWDAQTWLQLQKPLHDLGVTLIEQPMPEGKDQGLADHEHLIPVCADESCHTCDDLEHLKGKYDFINIKLDKTGGLTQALKLKDAGIEMGFGIMAGCMVGSSLAMAPAVVFAQAAQFTDLDGPLLLAEDREPALVYEGSTVYPSRPELWG